MEVSTPDPLVWDGAAVPTSTLAPPTRAAACEVAFAAVERVAYTPMLVDSITDAVSPGSEEAICAREIESVASTMEFASFRASARRLRLACVPFVVASSTSRVAACVAELSAAIASAPAGPDDRSISPPDHVNAVVAAPETIATNFSALDTSMPSPPPPTDFAAAVTREIDSDDGITTFDVSSRVPAIFERASAAVAVRRRAESPLSSKAHAPSTFVSAASASPFANALSAATAAPSATASVSPTDGGKTAAIVVAGSLIAPYTSLA